MRRTRKRQHLKLNLETQLRRTYPGKKKGDQNKTANCPINRTIKNNLSADIDLTSDNEVTEINTFNQQSMDQALVSNMSIDCQIELFEIMNQNDVNSKNKNKNCTKTSNKEELSFKTSVGSSSA